MYRLRSRKRCDTDIITDIVPQTSPVLSLHEQSELISDASPADQRFAELQHQLRQLLLGCLTQCMSEFFRSRRVRYRCRQPSFTPIAVKNPIDFLLRCNRPWRTSWALRSSAS